jgi:hypothetical protein
VLSKLLQDETATKMMKMAANVMVAFAPAV